MDVIAAYTGAKAGVAFSTNVHIGGDRHSLRGSRVWRDVGPERMAEIGEKFRQFDQQDFEKIADNSRLEVLHDADQWGVESLQQRPDIVYYGEHFGLGRRLASRLSDHPGWIEALTLQFDRSFEIVPMSSRQLMGGIVQQLTFRDPEQSTQLQLAISLAVGTTGGSGSQVETLMDAERASGKRSVLIEVTPLSDGLQEIGNNFHGALIYLIDPENPLACGLSEAEAAVCERLAHGWKNSDIAEDRNVSIDTIKTQVAQVFNKAGVSNRSELIRLIPATKAATVNAYQAILTS